MTNDLLKKLEEKINEAIETIELSRMEVSDLKEQNEELENRYSDWETRLSTLIEKFEQLEDSENGDVEEGVSVDMQSTDGEPDEEVEAAETLDSDEEEDEDEQDSDEEVEAAETLDSEEEDEEEQDSDDEEELGSTFDTSADSFIESPESAQHYA